jgi:hypothetical protein
MIRGKRRCRNGLWGAKSQNFQITIGDEKKEKTMIITAKKKGE